MRTNQPQAEKILNTSSARDFAKQGSQYWPTARRVHAIQVTTETEWVSSSGDRMCAKQGDWMLTDNEQNIWSVNREIFEETYTANEDGSFSKTSPIWAKQTRETIGVETLEGVRMASPGDWIVSNGQDAWVISERKLETKYSVNLPTLR